MSEKQVLVLPRTVKRIKLVPPDGGWGWIILLGIGVSNVFNQSMLSLFSLLYGDALEAMGHKTQGAAIVLSVMLFVSNFSGPIAGALVKLTSARFVSVAGSFLSSLGIFVSGFSTNIAHLIISYGVLIGVGLGFIQNASFVSINSYFKLKKSIAVGIAMAGTGIGQTVMPHVVRYLLDKYGFLGACLLLSGLSLHGICGTLLIQPVEWHLKKVEEEVVIDEKSLFENKCNATGEVYNRARRATIPSVLLENEKQKVDSHKLLSQSFTQLQQNGKPNVPMNEQIINTNGNKVISMLKNVYDLLDISLLTNIRFLNVIIGTSLTFVSIQNFSMLYPLFLQKVANMDKQETANCMSAVAIADIIGRLALPQAQAKFNISVKMAIILTSIWCLVVRQILAYQTDMYVLLVLSLFYGIGRSMVIVSRNIAIADECRMDQVASAVGLGMLSMGLLVPPVGYFLGWIRDYTGSYIVCITAQNAILVIFLIMWIPDMLYQYCKEKRKQRNRKDETQLT
ncbi:monocarboxylate transporter 12-B-like [Zerene cesonia]|uniref:monocarboxylate transporter 12-B-like n=1 Tax=Zerene cesonia TaxID=33412 RepID=UPI0018E59463|nr:monocarboxylate transporter 12-B-like [Zerene cesonia]XP_038208363.1 monocarboxylate transporter 12-B-like [Zerene cesonia]